MRIFLVIFFSKTKNMNYVSLMLAAILLLCLAPMSYGYYQLVRFVVMVTFGVMTYQYYNQKKEALTITLGALALLFQPFAKIALGRVIWNVVDVAVAFGLFVLFFEKRKKERRSDENERIIKTLK